MIPLFFEILNFVVQNICLDEKSLWINGQTAKYLIHFTFDKTTMFLHSKLYKETIRVLLAKMTLLKMTLPLY